MVVYWNHSGRRQTDDIFVIAKSKTRQIAIEQGHKRYHGSPCISCGGTEKFVSSFSCTACTTKAVSNRSPEIGKRYARSKRGKHVRKEYKKTDVYKTVQNRYRRKKYKTDSLYKQSVKNKQLKRMYGLNLETYNLMLEEQNHKCAICGIDKKECRRDFAVDHDHITGIIRKLLCGKCNMTLGLVGENIQILMNMISYLKEHLN